jgi:hypothetical protein
LEAAARCEQRHSFRYKSISCSVNLRYNLGELDYQLSSNG